MKKIIKDLVNGGIRYAFGVTGSGASIKLIASLQRAGVEYFPVSHEAAAVFMAGACCRDGKTQAVAITIKGPGFINLMPGIVSNFYEGRPALTISEAYAQDAPIFKTHKRLNHKSICRSVCKAYGISNYENIITELLVKSQEEPPGPAHLDLVSGSDIVQTNNPKIEHEDVSVNEQHIKTLEKLLTSSKQPCLILGSSSRRLKVDWNSIKVPVVTTAAAKGCYDETLKWSAGVITGEVTELSPESSVLYNSDLIIAIGLRNTEVIKIESYSAPLVMIDNINQGLQYGFDPEILFVKGNLNSVFNLLLKKLINKSWGANVIEKQRVDIYKALLSDQWLTSRAFNTLQKSMSGDTVLVLDTGFFCTVGETIWKAMRPDLFCSSSVGRFMGSAIPTAIGVSISSQSSSILCVMGDGGISPYVGEISIAVREKLPIVFVLMTDGRYGSVAVFSSSDIETKRAVNVGVESWCDIVRGMNCDAIQVNNEIDLIEVLDGWQGKTSPLFIELPFEADNYAVTARKLR